MNIGKKRSLLFVAILVLILLFTVPFFPIVGGIVAAERIEKYVYAVYDIEPVDWYAKYNPVSSSYYMTIQKTDEESLKIVCDKEGNIFDSERSKAILNNPQVEEAFALQNDKDQRQFGYLTCYWKFNSPEVSIITLHVNIRECIEPFPDTDNAMRAKMADRFAIYYNLLEENVRDTLSEAYISYQHYTEERENLNDNDNCVYSIFLNLNDDGRSITNKIYSSIITKDR